MNQIILAGLAALALATALAPAHASTISCSAYWDSPFCTTEKPPDDIHPYPVWSAYDGEMIGSPGCFMSPHRADLVCKLGEVGRPGGQRDSVAWWVGVLPGGITDLSPEEAADYEATNAPDPREITSGSKRIDAIKSELGEDAL